MKKFTKPKIVISSYDDVKNPYYGGGGAMAIHEVAKGLTDKYEAMVVTGRYPKSKNEQIDGVVYKRIGISSGFAKLDQLLFNLFLLIEARSENYDLWVESFTPPFSTSFLPILTKKPVVGLVHMLSAADMERKYKLPFHLIENLELKFYKDFIVSSEVFREKILKQNPRARVSVIPPGVNLPEIKRTNGKKHILFIGRVEVNQKGLDLLLAAYKLIADKLDYPLVIAGAGEAKEERKLKRIIKNLGLERKVELVGRLEREKKKEVFEKAIAVVIPSRFETFSLVALEALSYKVPIVCFDIEGLRWLSGDICLKVRPFDIEGLSKSIIYLSKNTSKRARMANNGRGFVKGFSWDATAINYENTINKLLKPSKVVKEDVVKNIIDKEIECYFISPHFDDAAFSAGGLISYLVGKTKVTVVNVFTKAGGKPYTLSAREYLKQCGYQNALKLYSDRRKEDRLVFKKAKVNVINLGFTEALWRKKTGNAIAKSMGRILPEATHIYPTYKFNVARGIVSKKDEQLVNELESKLTKLVKGKNYLVFCPIAIGKHVDHVIVRDVCNKAFSNTIFWADYPYNLGSRPDEDFINQNTSGKSVFGRKGDQKEKLMKGYKSQIKAIFPTGKIKLMPEIYYIGSKMFS